MSVTYYFEDRIPKFICLSTDVTSGSVAGISVPGAHVFFTDTGTEWVVGSDLKLVHYAANTVSGTSGSAPSGSSGSSVFVTNLPTTQVISGSASEYHIGEIGGRMTSGSFEFTNTSGSNTAYSIGDTVSGSATIITPYEIPNIFRVAGGSGYVVSLGAGTDKSSVVPAFRVHFYSGSSVTLSGDNLPYLDSYADTQYKLRPFDLSAMTSSTNTSGSLSRSWDTTTIRQAVIAQPGSKSLWIIYDLR